MLFVVFVFEFEVFVNIFTKLEYSLRVGFTKSIPIRSDNRMLAMFKSSELGGHDWSIN